ncbi:chromosome partitioning protein [Prosthecobacter debontii]|uniref:Chromosome partitioning protein n=1 Tax=Prosthecobacter debontii TaxID=48467 RepID=A0A1T4XSX6_9BACT|nr:ParA family protein [Prosthecobacter debontii]SKA92624.1 chromosome partitioning protein [Prosthecobacter debontii]
MPSHIVAFLNFKGGVGKTTNTVNIAAIMAMHKQLAGRRVLVIDLDPQSNTTLWLINREGYRKAFENDLTIHKLFTSFEKGGKPDLSSLIQTGVLENLTTGGRLDLVPGSFQMLELEERPSLGHHIKQADGVLAAALRPLREDYDYILIDCPPAWSLFTRNALRAADFILVPYTPDYLALEGIKWINQLLRKYTHDSAPNRVAKLGGVIVNRYRNFQPVQAALLEMREVLDVYSQLQNLDIQVFEPMIREASAVTDSNNVQQALVTERPYDPVTKDLVALTQNLITFFQRFPKPDA